MISDAAAALNHAHLVQIDVKALEEAEQLSLVERHLISPLFVRNKNPISLMLQPDESISVMLNEEDHIRIQAFSAGDNMLSSFEAANRIDDLIEEFHEIAFDGKYGYLTSCPTNAGTGLRASFMLHLPMLERSGQIANIFHAIAKFGMTVRGVYGEGTESYSSMYQLSNQITLGKSETEIIDALRNMTSQLINIENAARDKALEGSRLAVEDKIYRSCGILNSCRTITAKEASALLSDMRLGHVIGLDMPELNTNIYNLIVGIQPGMITIRAGKDGNVNYDKVRADYIRGSFV
jgi:protein arginine kinase